MWKSTRQPGFGPASNHLEKVAVLARPQEGPGLGLLDLALQADPKVGLSSVPITALQTLGLDEGLEG